MNRNSDTIDAWDIDGEEIYHFGEGFSKFTGSIFTEKTSHIQHYPFCKLDKRVVLAFYKKYGQLVSLGGLTNSCEGFISERGDPKFSKVCHQCWWCIEKEWATAMIFHYDANESMKDWPGRYPEDDV